MMLVHGGEGWHSTSHAVVDLKGPKTLTLYPNEDKGEGGAK